MYKLIVAPSAAADLNAVVDYIASVLRNPIAANVLLDSIEDAYDILETSPLAFPFCDDPVLRGCGYHQIGVKNYIVIYRVEDDSPSVRILHIYHATQDYLAKVIGEI